jgi:hypothetical protein
VSELASASLGVTQHVPGDRMQRSAAQFDAQVAYAVKAEEHVWIVAVAHSISAEAALAALEGREPVILDAESVRVTGVGCYRCEKPFERRLIGKRCRGVP